MHIVVAALAWLGLWVAVPAAVGAPAPDAERVAIDLRRMLLIVSNIENSLRFYRDALGFRVIDDNRVLTPRDTKSGAEADISRRLVFVRANDDCIGIIGLLQFTKPVREPEPIPFSTGSAVLLFTTQDLATRCALTAPVPGVSVLDPPTATSYSSYDG